MKLKKQLLRFKYIQNNRSQPRLDSAMQENEYLWQWSCIIVCACSTGFPCCVTVSQKAFRVGRNSIIYWLYYSTAARLFFLTSVEAQRLIRSVWDFRPNCFRGDQSWIWAVLDVLQHLRAVFKKTNIITVWQFQQTATFKSEEAEYRLSKKKLFGEILAAT